MHHSVMVGIDIDDDAVRKTVVNGLSDKLIAEIKEGLLSKQAGGDYFKKRDWNQFLNKVVEDILESDGVKEEVIELAAEKLADSVKRTKAWKEKYKDVAEL